MDQQHQFGSAHQANPLGATIALDGSAPAFGDIPNANYGGAPAAAPAYGAPPAGGGFGGPPPAMDGGFGGPPPGAYGAPPGPADYGAHNQGYNQPPMGHPMPGMGGPMQPYGGGAPMAGMGGMPGQMMMGGEQKSFMTTLLLAVFVGTLGVHRFYTGHTLIGVLQLVTCGGGGFWTLFDIIMIAMGKYTDAHGRPLAK